MILPHLSHKAVAYLMNASKTCVITSDSTGGSQRTVLEAMACELPVLVVNKTFISNFGSYIDSLFFKEKDS